MIKKNNKGFTLIEVIAVVTLLGILTFLVVPQIYSLVTDSRKNVYVQDAIRLISQAQYAMNAKSVKIDKPDDGECIVFSMKYLSSSDFQSPPNGGSYLPESSFVIVKNSGGEYIYSTMLVEKTKDNTYMGVELTTEKALNAKNAIKHVRIFDVDEIAYIDENTNNLNGGVQISATYINSYLNTGDDDEDDWSTDDDEIIGIYNGETEDDDTVIDTSVPKMSAKFSTSGSLQTVLSVSASDADNARSDLTVCVKISRATNEGYPDPTKEADSHYCHSYGNDNFFTMNIDFSLAENGGFSYENKGTALVYITVADPNNNVTHKRLSYDIHQNEEPKISFFTVEKLDTDKHNMPTAKVALSLSDDMDNQNNLQVCFVQDDKYATSCSDYHPYSYYFGSSGTYNYQFKDSNGQYINEPDGSSHNLKVFIRDSMELQVEDNKDYKIYKNKAPEITLDGFGTSCMFTRDNGSCICTHGCYQLSVVVNLTANDDITPSDNLIVKLFEVNASNERVGEISMAYGQFINSNKVFTFSGSYDGKPRVLHVEVIDEFNKVTSRTQQLSSVYKDQPPTIVLKKDGVNNIPFVSSAEPPCSGAASCSVASNGGSYNAILSFDVEDDLSNKDSLKVCVSENQNDCSLENISSSNFVPYANINTRFSFSADSSLEGLIYPSTNIVKKLYAATVDDQGNYQAYGGNPVSYKLYGNKSPSFGGGFSLKSSDTSNPPRNLTTVKFDLSNLSVIDDFNDYQVRLCYKINNGNQICSKYYNYAEMVALLEEYYEFRNADDSKIPYNGQRLDVHFEVKDNYGKTANTDNTLYRLYTDGAPSIKDARIESTDTGYNSYTFRTYFKVIDVGDTYSVCVTDQNECSDEQYVVMNDGSPFVGDGQEYSIVTDGHAEYGWSDQYQDSEPNKHLHLFVKDSNGHISSKDLDYKVYVLCSDPDKMEQLDENPTYEYDDSDSNNNRITASYCQGVCYHNMKTTDNVNHVNYMVNTNDRFGNYNKTLMYQDHNVELTCPVTVTETQYCNYVSCFDTFSDSIFENNNVISMELSDPDFEWSYSDSRVTKEVVIEKPYCENLGSSDYFHPNDRRCLDPEFCQTKGLAYCEPIVSQEQQVIQEQNDTLKRNYETNLEIYTLERAEAYTQYLLVKYHGYSIASDESPSPSPSPSTEPVAEELDYEQAFRMLLEGIEIDSTRIDAIINYDEYLTQSEMEDITNYIDPLQDEDRNLANQYIIIIQNYIDYVRDVDPELASSYESVFDLTPYVYIYPEEDLDDISTVLSAIGFTEEQIEMVFTGELEFTEENIIAIEEYLNTLTDMDLVDRYSTLFGIYNYWLTFSDEERQALSQYLSSIGISEDDIKLIVHGRLQLTDEQLVMVKSYLVSLAETDLDLANRYRVLLKWNFEIVPLLNYCPILSLNHDNHEWFNEKFLMCTDYSRCNACKKNNNLIYCDQFSNDESCDVYLPPKIHDVKACYALGNNDDCQYLEIIISDGKEQFLTAYDSQHPVPREPSYQSYDYDSVLNSCVERYKETCLPFYDYCQEEFTSYKKAVSCSEEHDIGPIYCRKSGFEDGFCLENDDTCPDPNDENDCQEVCYKEYDCTEQKETRPISFTCHGYFKVYRSSLIEERIKLEETEMRICPDFYRLYRNWFIYDSNADMPYIVFNPNEVGREK